ncbi:MAG: dockerin type I repeat-containing protein [Ruminococcus sp.]|nr:dockerin type I repeat-containing protein [Ruminococcus sp.]
MKKTNLRIIAFAFALIFLMSVCTMGSVYGSDRIYEGVYYEAMVKYLRPYFDDYKEFPVEQSFGMKIAYEHYSSENDSTPDYIVVEIISSATKWKVWYEVDGYCIGYYYQSYDDTPLTYYVIDTETMAVTELSQVLEANKDKYSDFLTESRYENVVLIGDLNRDNTLDIRDATLIQKCIAGIESYGEYDVDCPPLLAKHKRSYASDFNYDGVRNVKDATAIQKYIAGLEY